MSSDPTTLAELAPWGSPVECSTFTFLSDECANHVVGNSTLIGGSSCVFLSTEITGVSAEKLYCICNISTKRIGQFCSVWSSSTYFQTILNSIEIVCLSPLVIRTSLWAKQVLLHKDRQYSKSEYISAVGVMAMNIVYLPVAVVEVTSSFLPASQYGVGVWIGFMQFLSFVGIITCLSTSVIWLQSYIEIRDRRKITATEKRVHVIVCISIGFLQVLLISAANNISVEAFTFFAYNFGTIMCVIAYTYGTMRITRSFMGMVVPTRQDSSKTATVNTAIQKLREMVTVAIRYCVASTLISCGNILIGWEAPAFKFKIHIKDLALVLIRAGLVFLVFATASYHKNQQQRRYRATAQMTTTPVQAAEPSSHVDPRSMVHTDHMEIVTEN